MTASLPTDPALSRARELADAGAWHEVLAILEPRAATCARDGLSALLYAEALMRLGNERKALGWLSEVEPSLGDGGDRAAQRRALNMMGVASLTLGQLEDATVAFARALDMASQSDDPLVLARATNNLGTIANMQGDHERALSHYRLALPTFQRLGQRRGLASSYHNLAITYRDLGELEESDEHELRAIEHATEGGVPRLAAMGRVGRAEVALRRGDAALAETTARIAREEFARLGDPQNEADASRLIGAACTAQRRYADALEAFDRALEIARDRGHALNEAETLRDRSALHLAQGHSDEALEDARLAITLFDRLGATRERDSLRERMEG
ncbi:MAG TPA: tetratricopeptide repeat protein [Gemmatimonadaceae bacterium]|nr:tetratricopeptide repeat protein [Gemmatimonadaceae bacterium]